MYSPIRIINHWIEYYNIKEFNQMKIQRMLFFSQSWHLYLYDLPLIDGTFVKWESGPSLVELYCVLGSFKSDPITDYIQYQIGDYIITSCVNSNDKITIKFLAKIVDIYGGLTPQQLSNISLIEGGACSKTEIGSVVTQELMKECIKHNKESN